MTCSRNKMCCVGVVLCLLFTAGSIRAQGIGVAEGLAAAALAKEILAGISNKVLGDVKARVDAEADSAGPDNDDLYSIAQADTYDGFMGWEWQLRASTYRANGAKGKKLGLNGGKPHVGMARMTVERKQGTMGWYPTWRYAWARAAVDTTPAPPPVDNTTAAAAVSTFANNGKIKKKYTKTSSFAPTGGTDVVSTSAMAVGWSRELFGLEDVDVGGTVFTQVTSPVASMELFHRYMQLDTSPNWRERFVSPLGEDTLVGQMVADSLERMDADMDSFLGTSEFSPGGGADLTLVGATMLMAPGLIEKGTKTDEQVIAEYLQSSAVSFAAPSHAQSGYVPVVETWLLGGGAGFPSGNILSDDNGFMDTPGPDDSPGDPQEIAAQYDMADDIIGLVIQGTGSFSAALNLAEISPAHPLYTQLNTMSVGEVIELTTQFSSSGSAIAASQANIVIPEPATMGLMLLGSLVWLRERRS